MPGEQNIASSDNGRLTGLHLLPCAVIAGIEAPQYDDRLQGAQSALNRIPVWLGDILIDFRHRRQLRAAKSPEKSLTTLASDPGRV